MFAVMQSCEKVFTGFYAAMKTALIFSGGFKTGRSNIKSGDQNCPNKD